MSTSLFNSTDRRSLVRRVVIAAVVVAGTLAFLVGQSHGGRPTTSEPQPTRATAAGGAGPSTTPLPAPTSDAPDGSDAATEFAREVAHVVFTWDTVPGPDPTTIRGELVTLADPTGEETPGLIADLDAYLPTDTAWRHLESLGARQWIDVDRADVPAGWADAVALEPGLAGTFAVNVIGTRHREATAKRLADHSANPVRFTAFVRCLADGPCSLLRLGRIGETWES